MQSKYWKKYNGLLKRAGELVHQRAIDEQIARFDGETTNIGVVICPHCGWADGWARANRDGHCNCHNCGGRFAMKKEVTYSTFREDEV